MAVAISLRLSSSSISDSSKVILSCRASSSFEHACCPAGRHDFEMDGGRDAEWRAGGCGENERMVEDSPREGWGGWLVEMGVMGRDAGEEESASVGLPDAEWTRRGRWFWKRMVKRKPGGACGAAGICAIME